MRYKVDAISPFRKKARKFIKEPTLKTPFYCEWLKSPSSSLSGKVIPQPSFTIAWFNDHDYAGGDPASNTLVDSTHLNIPRTGKPAGDTGGNVQEGLP